MNQTLGRQFLVWLCVQVNLFQKPLFLHQLTHNMTRDCSLNFPKNTSSEHVVYKNCFCFCFDIQNNICTQHVVNLYFSGNSMNNLSSYCGLTDSRMRASDTDLPVNSKTGSPIKVGSKYLSMKPITKPWGLMTSSVQECCPDP